MRLGAVFIAICMVVIAASAGATVHLGFGLSATASIIVALAVLTALGLYNAVSARRNMRSLLGSQISDLSRNHVELARLVTELNRRIGAIEGRVDAVQRSARAATDPLAIEISELGTLVRQLAETVATDEAKSAEIAKPAPARPARAGKSTATTLGDNNAPAAASAVATLPEPAPAAPALAPVPKPMVATAAVPDTGVADRERLAVIRRAIDANRIDLYLQPIVTLPQRKVRYYEAVSRLRTETGDVLPAADFIPPAQRAGLMAQIDNLVVFRCVQVVRRLLLKNRDIGLFCNLSESTLTDGAMFQQLIDFLDANRAIAPSVVLEFTQSALRSAGPIENESLSALAERGFRFSLDNLQDLRIEPRELAAQGFRYIKISGHLLLNPKDTAADIHPADLSDLLGRFGIDLIADKIENEAMVVDLLDYDVRFGQGFLFSPPRPVRAEALHGIADRGDVIVRDSGADDAPAPSPATRNSGVKPAPDGAESRPRTTGLAQLARGAGGRV